MTKTGFQALNNASQLTSTQTGKILQSLKLDNLAQNTGRVISVVLDDTHPRYLELGGPKAIGAVEYVDVKEASLDYSTTVKNQKYSTAFPLDPSIKKYPLINEIIFLTSLPSKNIQQKSNTTATYYISTVNIWNHPHHNAIPYSAGSLTGQNSKNYQTVELGSTNKLTDSTGTIKLGNYFVERTGINPLRPFEGDSILEGRFGNSIRIGSTGGPNPWSETGEQGSPIMILKNGQGEIKQDSWSLVTEDVNLDQSSIYLTSNQKIPVNVASTNNFFSYKEGKPEFPNQYTGNQILITSGRLVLNAQNDHILLTSAKTVNLNSIQGIHLDTTSNVVIQSGKTLIGSKSATEPLLLGDALVTQLEELVNILKELLLASSTAANSGGPIPTLNQKAIELLTRANLIDLQLTKSKRNFTV